MKKTLMLALVTLGLQMNIGMAQTVPPNAPPTAPTTPITPTAPPALPKPVVHQDYLKELNLTADQNAKVKAIFQASQAKVQALVKDTTLTTEQRRDQMKQIRKANQDAIHAILTPEQQAKLKDLQSQHKAPPAQ